jgi:hypothetical protein
MPRSTSISMKPSRRDDLHFVIGALLAVSIVVAFVLTLHCC